MRLPVGACMALATLGLVHGVLVLTAPERLASLPTLNTLWLATSALLVIYIVWTMCKEMRGP